jgi:type I restriction-modification system DNA methylase subunit
MSTTHGQPGLSSDQRSTIRSTILSTRHALEDELRRQLEKYGIYEDKKLPLDNLTHLSIDEVHVREKIDAAIERELESTEGDLERSITNYVREATKTYLNRFVALKTIEVRGLVEETITERPEYGNRSYIHHTVAEIAGELTDASDDGFGAALDLAYQEIGAEIRMIFEESEHTAIDLDAQVREEVLDELDKIDDEAWESDEALGWVYQYFGEEEREDIDKRVSDENYKIGGTDVATKTQLFTPRYIVEWMVDNSLGRTWLEMRGGRTNINNSENCFYLTPLEDSLIDREEKSVEEITVLDPACGSGHMLFYAFDVLYQMYLEEGEVPEKYIPREILRNNLYGIDIDSGAAQIAALSLYLKGKEKSPEVTIPQLNIVSADAVLINGDRKKEIVERAGSELEEKILEQIWRSFDNIREWGSLVRIEEQVDEILEEYQETFQKQGQTQFTDEGTISAQSTIVTNGEEETWEELKNRLMKSVQDIAKNALEHDDPVEEMFADEVGKTVEIIDLLHAEYDVVVSNPPYLYRDKMADSLKEFVKDNYIGSRDLYAAFIERCMDFAGDNNYVSMITMENFMFLYSFRSLRPYILDNANFVDSAHLEHRDEGYMNICFSMRMSDNDTKDSKFVRLTDSDDKISSLNKITQKQRSGNSPNNVYSLNQESFREIDRTPFIYWFGQEVLQLFVEEPNLGEAAEVMEGLGTGDDDKYIRNWWEIDQDWIGDQYFWFARSGDGDLYYESYEQTVLWENDGEEIRNYSGSRIGNTEYYGEPGITFRDFAKHFTARIHQEDYIFSNKAHFVYTGDAETDYQYLGYLSSSLSRFIMNGLNPGLNFKSGDGARLPIKPGALEDTQVEELIPRAIEAQQKKCTLKETKPDFDSEILFEKYPDIQYYKDLLDAEVAVIHGKVDDIVFDSYDMSSKTQNRAYDELPPNLYHYPHISNIGGAPADSLQLKTKNISESEINDIISSVREEKDEGLRSLSESLEISPYTIAELRNEYDLYTSEEKENWAGSLLSCYLGCIMGKWELKELSPVSDGIIAFDEEPNKSIPEYVQQCLEITFDDPDRIYNRLSDDLGKDPIDWLRDSFFRYHHCKEYRRRGQRIPIYWQLESPNGSFSCFVYYHKIDKNTLPKLRGKYLDPRINRLENELETLNAQTSGNDPDKELLKRREKVQDDLDDIRDFRNTIDEMIDDGVSVDLEKGIWENIKEWDQYKVLETGLPKLKSSYSR